MKFIVFCDLDGTLVKHRTIQVGAINVQAITRFVQAGNFFVINTGRWLYWIKPVVDKINENHQNVQYVISLAGSYIYDTNNNHLIYKKTINDHLGNKLLQEVLSYKLPTIVYCDESFQIKAAYGFNLKPKCFFYKLIENVPAISLKQPKSLSGIYKFLIWYFRPSVGQKYGNLLKAKFKDQVEIIIQRHYIEVVAKDVNKGLGIKEWFKFTKLNPNDFQTVAIGDAENDLQMFETCDQYFIVADKPKKSNLNYLNKIIINNKNYLAVSKILNLLLKEQQENKDK